MLGIHYDEYNELLDGKRNKMNPSYKLKELFLEKYNYNSRTEDEESSDTTRKSGKEESPDD